MLCAPLDRVTRNMVPDRSFNLVQNDAIFVNTYRSVDCDEIALINALQVDRLFGVGIDITEIEPIQPDNLLLAMPNVLIAP